jgi:hypothetical protein
MRRNGMYVAEQALNRMTRAEYRSSQCANQAIGGSQGSARNDCRICPMSCLALKAQITPVDARLMDFIGIMEQQRMSHVNLRRCSSQFNCEPLLSALASRDLLSEMVHYRASDPNDGRGR